MQMMTLVVAPAGHIDCKGVWPGLPGRRIRPQMALRGCPQNAQAALQVRVRQPPQIPRGAELSAPAG